MTQMRIENLNKKVDNLVKIDINDIAYGRVDNDKTQYHAEIEDIAHKLRVFARDLTMGESNYIKENQDRKVLKVFNDIRETFGGDTIKAMAALYKTKDVVKKQKNEYNRQSQPENSH